MTMAEEDDKNSSNSPLNSTGNSTSEPAGESPAGSGTSGSGENSGPISDSQAPTRTGGPLIPSEQLLPQNLFILPVNGRIVFPTLLAPLVVSQPRLVAMIEEAINRQRVVGLLLTRDGDVKDEPKPEELYEFGVAVKIIKRLKLPDGSINLLLHGMKRFRSKRVLSDNPYIVVEAEYLEDVTEKSNEMDALTRSVVSHVKKLAEVNPFFTEEMRLAMINAPGPGTVADLVAYALTLPKNDAQEYLETLVVTSRFEKLLVHLRREQDVADLQRKINDDVNNKINKLQREFFLKEQLKSLKRELGMEEDGKDKMGRTFRERIEEAGMPEDARKVALEEVERLETISENSPEYNITRNYIETLVSLPWSKETVDNLNLEHAEGVLDAEHYGLEKVKERILEFLAVRKLRKDVKGSIICLVGPPGVGKTSLGKSIAKTLGRSFFRFSLGGMRDEAEIKGHRRTYVGAMPGKVLQGMKRAGTKNCVLMLDEIDKLGQSFQGDPASALLEVLDPEQNTSFLDHYVDVPYDLSHVLFITTANTTSTIPGPLLDRMEVIEIPRSLSSVPKAGARVISQYLELSLEALKQDPRPDFLVWPETSYPSTFRNPVTADELMHEHQMENLVRSQGIPLLFGGYDRANGKDFNALFTLSPVKNEQIPTAAVPFPNDDLQVYRKNILLLFGEYVPFTENWPLFAKLFPQVGNFGRGTGPEVIQIPLKDKDGHESVLRAGPVICYEVLFPNYVIEAAHKGSQLILNITNDSWFGPYGEPILHLSLSVFRSIETRLPQLRSTNTGISALVLPDGTLAKVTAVDAAEVMNVRIPLIEDMPTLMKAWGDWFGMLCAVVGSLGFLGLKAYQSSQIQE